MVFYFETSEFSFASTNPKNQTDTLQIQNITAEVFVVSRE